jgi:hypothetical protein
VSSFAPVFCPIDVFRGPTALFRFARADTLFFKQRFRESQPPFQGRALLGREHLNLLIGPGGATVPLQVGWRTVNEPVCGTGDYAAEPDVDGEICVRGRPFVGQPVSGSSA